MYFPFYSFSARFLLTFTFSVSMLLFSFQHVFAHNEITSRQSGLWSDPATWKNNTVPGYHDSVNIKKGTTVTYDIEADEMIDMLHVDGTLRFSTTKNTRLLLNEAMIMGKWQMGTEKNPIPSSVTAQVELTGDDKMIEVEDGKFIVFGAPQSVTWTHLEKTAKEGTTEILLQESVGWKKNDRIVIAPTGYKSTQAEERTIVAVSKNKKVLTLDKKLKYDHLGTSQQAAEVGLLSHNITFQGEGKKKPGHIMFMGDSVIQIRSAAFDTLGNYGVVARYPLHFHMMGNQKNSFVKQVAVTNSKNRCVVLHGTNDVVVKDVVSYKTKGHCYFLEDGVEERNSFIHNLGVQTIAGGTLSSDKKPATFWITNPNNTYKNNSAAGSEEFGFWFHIQDAATGLSDDSSIVPSERPLRLFTGNITHSNEQHGLTIDSHGSGSVSYEPKNGASFTNIFSYKNGGTGIWMRGKELTVKKSKLSDNRVGLVFAGKNNTLKSSTIIGVSGVMDGTQKAMNYIHGVQFYDGPMHVKNSTFKNFESSATQIQAALSMKTDNLFAMSPENSFTENTFKNAQKFHLHTPEHNGELFTVLHDLDAKKTILPFHVFHKSSGCVKKEEWNVYSCEKQEYGQLFIIDTKDGTISTSMDITRSDTGAIATMKKEGKAATGEFIVNLPTGKIYELSLKNNDQLTITLQDAAESLTLRLPYSEKPEKIMQDGKEFTDWTYNESKKIAIVEILPNKKTIIYK